MTAGAVQRIADIVRQQRLGLQVQTHAADDLVGIGGSEQVGQARGLKSAGVGGLWIELTAQSPHLLRRDSRAVVTPAAAHEAEDFGDFLIRQTGKARHGVDPRMGGGLRGFPAGQGDVQQGRRVTGGNARITGQWREHARHATTIGAVAVAAKLGVTQPATAAEQVGGRRRWRQCNRRHGQVVVARR
ncbi:hypothetical protein D3C79_624720 [compost metagenome]